MTPTMDPALTHELVRAYECVWGAGLRAPEMNEEFAGFEGLVGMGRYFATRAAPLGSVPAEVVVATFYNFGPDAVRPHIPSAWAIASPQEYLDAERRAVGRALDRALRRFRTASSTRWRPPCARPRSRLRSTRRVECCSPRVRPCRGPRRRPRSSGTAT